MTFYIDGPLNINTAKSFERFLVKGADKDLTIIVDSPGGETRATDCMIHSLTSHIHKLDSVTILIVGAANSSAFDLVYGLSKIGRVKVLIGTSHTFCIHRMSTAASVQSEEEHRSYRGNQERDLNVMLEQFGRHLKPAQLRSLKKGEDVFLSLDQAKTILNAGTIS